MLYRPEYDSSRNLNVSWRSLESDQSVESFVWSFEMLRGLQNLLKQCINSTLDDTN
jgi:hypothetical protein